MRWVMVRRPVWCTGQLVGVKNTPFHCFAAKPAALPDYPMFLYFLFSMICTLSRGRTLGSTPTNVLKLDNWYPAKTFVIMSKNTLFKLTRGEVASPRIVLSFATGLPVTRRTNGTPPRKALIRGHKAGENE